MAQLNCELPGVDTLVRAWTRVHTYTEGHLVAHESGHTERSSLGGPQGALMAL